MTTSVEQPFALFTLLTLFLRRTMIAWPPRNCLIPVRSLAVINDYFSGCGADRETVCVPAALGALAREMLQEKSTK